MIDPGIVSCWSTSYHSQDLVCGTHSVYRDSRNLPQIMRSFAHFKHQDWRGVPTSKTVPASENGRKKTTIQEGRTIVWSRVFQLVQFEYLVLDYIQFLQLKEAPMVSIPKTYVNINAATCELYSSLTFTCTCTVENNCVHLLRSVRRQSTGPNLESTFWDYLNSSAETAVELLRHWVLRKHHWWTSGLYLFAFCIFLPWKACNLTLKRHGTQIWDDAPDSLLQFVDFGLPEAD